jgi:DNA-binding winged helix-turn-helix (wHTH) protein
MNVEMLEEVPPFLDWVPSWRKSEIGNFLENHPDAEHLPCKYQLLQILFKAYPRSVLKTSIVQEMCEDCPDPTEINIINQHIIDLRTVLPKGVSVYSIVNERRLILLPTLPEGRDILLPEHSEQIQKLHKDVQGFAEWTKQLHIEKDQLKAQTTPQTLALLDFLMMNWGHMVANDKLISYIDQKNNFQQGHIDERIRDIVFFARELLRQNHKEQFEIITYRGYGHLLVRASPDKN